jgi:hypothetical protein
MSGASGRGCPAVTHAAESPWDRSWLPGSLFPLDRLFRLVVRKARWKMSHMRLNGQGCRRLCFAGLSPLDSTTLGA